MYVKHAFSNLFKPVVNNQTFLIGIIFILVVKATIKFQS